MSGEANGRVSVIIPTLNAADTLMATLTALPPRDSGQNIAADIIVADAGSTDDTAARAGRAGARIIKSDERGRGAQMAAGAAAAREEWLLFLHADTRLQPGWQLEVRAFIQEPGNRRRAAAFRFALDADDKRARRVERLVAWRCKWLKLPYGDQGLLIHRDFYRDLGGFRPLPLMEDVALVRRIGRRRLAMLQTAAVTSASRFVRGGYIRRPARNITLVLLYYLGVPPRLLARMYA